MAIAGVGKVSRIYPHSAGCYIRLANLSPEPQYGYFDLPISHPNYNSLYSLALAAAINRYDLGIRVSGEISESEIATASYLWVDWPASAE